MRSIRAFAFNTLFYSWFIVYLLWCMVFFPLPRRIGWRAVKGLMRHELALQRFFGMEISIRGLENIPQGGFIVAAKHQSIWETFALLPMFEDAAFIYKKELGRVPFFGWYMRKFAQIAVDRSKGAQALRLLNSEAKIAIADNRQILIFPEGTRRPAGAPPDYKFGVAALYNAVNAPVLPIALNSGLFWSKLAWRGHKGRIIVDILPAIPPGLPRDVFFKTLQEQIETACDAQLLEISKSSNPPPFDLAAQQRLKQLTSPEPADDATATPTSDL